MYRRNITQKLLEALSDTPVVLVNGARQVGKSTLVQQLAKHQHRARYLTLDDATTLAASQEDPQGFIAGLTKPVIIDEVQRTPDLFLAIKADVDRNRKPGSFLLTGSADVLLLPGLSESLAGRMEILTLWPLSQGELKGKKEVFVDTLWKRHFPVTANVVEDKFDLVKRVLPGGYPEAVKRSPARRTAWFRSYITTLIQRDVRDFAHIEHLTMVPRLLSLLAGRATSLLNYSELSRSLGLPQSTLKRYFALLEMTFMVQLLPAWSANLGKRLVKAPKVIINDAGLLAHLLGLNAGRLESDPMLLGSLLENFVVMELQKQITWSRTHPKLYHFRTQTGQEVDILLEDGAGNVVGIEVKASTSVRGHDIRGLRLLADLLGKHFVRGIVLYLGDEAIPFGPHLRAIPMSTLWHVETGPGVRSQK